MTNKQYFDLYWNVKENSFKNLKELHCNLFDKKESENSMLFRYEGKVDFFGVFFDLYFNEELSCFLYVNRERKEIKLVQI